MAVELHEPLARVQGWLELGFDMNRLPIKSHPIVQSIGWNHTYFSWPQNDFLITDEEARPAFEDFKALLLIGMKMPVFRSQTPVRVWEWLSYHI